MANFDLVKFLSKILIKVQNHSPAVRHDIQPQSLNTKKALYKCIWSNVHTKFRSGKMKSNRIYKVNFRLSEAEYNRLKQLAKQNNMKMSDLFREFLLIKSSVMIARKELERQQKNFSIMVLQLIDLLSDYFRVKNNKANVEEKKRFAKKVLSLKAEIERVMAEAKQKIASEDL